MMTELPSGLVAGITNIRARYHATRQNIQVGQDSSLLELCRLVDVVLSPQDSCQITDSCWS